MRKHRILLKKLENLSLLKDEFDIQQLKSEKYLNFQFEDFYGRYDKQIFGRIRTGIFTVLLEIHNNWKIELDKLDQPYYLAIWINDFDLMLSEIVCAIDEKIEYYETEYFDNKLNKTQLSLDQFGKLNSDFKNFKWTNYVYFEKYESSDYNWPKEQYLRIKDYYKDKRFYKRVLPKSNKIEETKYGKVYSRKMGKIWVGRNNC